MVCDCRFKSVNSQNELEIFYTEKTLDKSNCTVKNAKNMQTI